MRKRGIETKYKWKNGKRKKTYTSSNEGKSWKDKNLKAKKEGKMALICEEEQTNKGEVVVS